MSVLSKIFEECVKPKTCNDLTHTGSCTANALHQAYRFYISNAKYYAPIVALSTLTKISTLNREVLKNAILYYLECVAGGWATGLTIQTLICVFRHLFGEFKYYSFLFVPSLIGALHIFWTRPRAQRLYTVSIFQSTIESILLRRRNFVTKAIADSVVLQTLLFMSSSALILHAKQIGVYKEFWLLKPNKRVNEKRHDEDIENIEIPNDHLKICAHDEHCCKSYLIQGVRSYFAFGLTLDIFKALMGAAPPNVSGFWPIIFGKIKGLNIRSTAFLTSYIGVYRFAHCYFNRRGNANLDINHQIAGFLSGICYVLMPSSTLLSYALTLSIQILWHRLITIKCDDDDYKSRLLGFLRQLPLTKIIFPFCLAHLNHVYCLQRNGVSNLAGIIINNTTDFFACRVTTKVYEFEKEMKLRA